MKQIYALLLIAGTVATAVVSRAENRQSVTVHRAPATAISVAETPAKMPARQTPGKMVISDLEKQVYGRYTCEYYSPVPDENYNTPRFSDRHNYGGMTRNRYICKKEENQNGKTI